MAAEESVKLIGVLASGMNSIAQMHVLVTNVSTAKSVDSALMRMFLPVVRKRMACKK